MKKIGIFLSFILLSAGLHAQRYLDFIENKGQWDASVKFKSELPGGAIVLQNNGYRVLQYNTADYTQLTEMFHHTRGKAGHEANEAVQENSKPFPMGNAGDDFTLRSHTYEVKFLNANPNPQIVPDKSLDAYSNYFIGNDPAKWAADCKTFQAVTYKNLYPNIDVRFYTSNETLKYDIIVHPGGNPDQVILYFDGVEGLKVKDEVLQIKTSVGTIQELAPFTYQLRNEQRSVVSTSFEVKGNFVRFKMNSAYDKSATLVIDPSVIFISYSGSSADNWGFTATYDGLGNFYAGGIVFSTGLPVSNGAFQTRFIGGNILKIDIGIIKFDPTGTRRMYATYIGGAGDDQPHSLIADRAGNLVIAGRTSSADYPTKGASSLVGAGGNFDILLTKLNATGTALIGSVRIGGSLNDGVNVEPNYPQNSGSISTRRNYGDDARSEVIVDNDNNILLASVTQSANFPVKNAFQNTPGSKQDGVVIKMDPTLDNVLFSSYLGGNDDDAAFVLSTNPVTGDIYVSGATASTDFPGDKAGVLFPGNQGTLGTLDGFITSIKSDGSAINKTTYIGTNGQDVIFGIQFDKVGSPYITGTTTGVFPSKNSPYNTKYPGQEGKHFIAKLTSDLSGFVFFTNFGSSTANKPSLSLTAFLVDRCQNMYVSGWGGSNIGQNYSTASLDGLIVTKDAYKKVTDGADFYFFILSKNADSLIYATFFGQDAGYPDHVDGGTSRFDPSGTIYQSICSCGDSRATGARTSIIGTPGSWSPTRANNACNLLAVKLAFYAAGVSSGIKPSINGVAGDSTGCVPLMVNFEDTVATADTYYWDFNGDGINDTTTTTPKANHLFSTVGNYLVRLISEDLNSCNEKDTSYIRIIVRNDAVTTLDYSYAVIPPCGNRDFSFTNLAQPPPGGSFTAASFEWDFGDGSAKIIKDGTPVTHIYPADGTYIVRLTLKDALFCNENDFIEKIVRVSSSFAPSFVADTACLGSASHFTYTGTGGQTFVWDFGDGTSPITTGGDATHTYARDGRYTVTVSVTDNNTCDAVKTKIFTANVLVSAMPISLFDYTPRVAQTNQIYSFTNLSSGGVSYQWNFGDSRVVFTSRTDTTIKHTFTASDTYNVCLYTTNSVGCVSTYCEPVTAEVNPLFDVPNAFTPNGDNVNDRIFVRGFGITKMTWRIYNRWGAVVFISTDIYEGWDGKVNGKLQPQEVYHYTVEVEFSDKVKATKKGDITLLR